MSPIRVHVVGLGRIAEHHLSAISKISGFTVGYLVDKDGEKSSLCEKYSALGFFETIKQLYAVGSPDDVVVICTPSGVHFGHVQALNQAGFKNFVVEKPCFLRVQDGLTIMRLLESGEIHNFVPVFQNRFNVAVQYSKSRIQQGCLGEILSAKVAVDWSRPAKYYEQALWRGTYSLDGGCLTNQCIHHLDCLRYLIGDVKWVDIRCRTANLDLEIEDTAVGSFGFGVDRVGSLHVQTSLRSIDREASISVYGSKADLKVGGIALNNLDWDTSSDQIDVSEMYSEDFSDCVYGNGHVKMYSALRSNNLRSPVSFEDALSTIRFLNACYLSDETQGVVQVNQNAVSQRLGVPDEVFDLYMEGVF